MSAERGTMNCKAVCFSFIVPRSYFIVSRLRFEDASHGFADAFACVFAEAAHAFAKLFTGANGASLRHVLSETLAAASSRLASPFERMTNAAPAPTVAPHAPPAAALHRHHTPLVLRAPRGAGFDARLEKIQGKW
jgi:hypothetical protein